MAGERKRRVRGQLAGAWLAGGTGEVYRALDDG
jgi:hypothetical protein